MPFRTASSLIDRWTSSLFVRIFLWFWLSMAIVTVALFLTVSTIQSNSDSEERIVELGVPGNRQGLNVLEHQGAEAFSDYVQHLENETGLRLYMVDGAHKDVLGNQIPEALNELVDKAFRSKRSLTQQIDGNRYIAIKTRGDRGSVYLSIIEFSPTILQALRETPYLQFVRIVLLLIASAIVCFWLTRYISKPVTKLASAAAQFAGGDMTARGGMDLGRRNDELGQLVTNFDQMAGRIASLIAGQQRLLAEVSHELRSPLARLTLSIGLARRSADAASQVHLDRAQTETERLNQRISQLLELARLESGLEQRGRDRVELSLLVQEVAEDGDFEARSLNRAVRITELHECSLIGSAELIRSAVENVIRNAVRYTPDGSQVEVSLVFNQTRRAASACLSVRDFGPGVPSEHIAKLFDPFYRVAGGAQPPSHGTGLGLTIAQRAVHLHGGQIQASNAAGGGLLVEIEFPAATA